MPPVSRRVPVSPETVFDTLSDGWLYGLWVVGTSHMRGVDDGWPAVGRRIHHSVGAWPILIDDYTEVTEVDAPRRLVLTARALPVGTARVDISLAPVSGGTTITMEETPSSGPARWLHNPVSEKLLLRRNVESMSRLVALVQRYR